MQIDLSELHLNYLIEPKSDNKGLTTFKRLEFYDDLNILINQSIKATEANEMYDCRISVVKHLHTNCVIFIDDVEIDLNPAGLRYMYCDNIDRFDKELTKDECATYMIYVTVYNKRWENSAQTQSAIVDNIKYIDDLLIQSTKETIIKLIETCIGYMVSQEDGF